MITRPVGDRRPAILAVLLVVLAGLALVVFIHAAGPYASITLSSSTLSGITVGADPAAFGGKYIQFVQGAGTSSTSTPTSSPSPSSMPTTATTGVIPGSALALHTGDYYLNTDGAAISNLHITGDLYLEANNVTATNVLVDGVVGINSAPGGNYFYPVKKNQRLINIDAAGISDTGFDTLTIDKCHFHNYTSTPVQLSSNQGSSNFYKADGLTLTNSLFDGLIPSSGSKHIESIHLMGVSDAVIRNNVFDIRTSDQATWNQITAAFTQQDWNGVGNNIVLDHNYFFGGSYYQVYLHATNMSVTNNAFTTFTSPGGAKSSVQYPPSAYAGAYPSFTQSGNTLDGQPYALPGGL